MQSVVLAIVNPSVRPSVRPSVCLSDRLSHAGIVSKMTPATIMRSSVEDSHMTLVSPRLTLQRNSKGNLRSEGAKWERGRKNRQFLANKSPYLGNGTRMDHSHSDRLIGSRMRAFDWYQNRRPWTAKTHSVAEKMRHLERTAQMWMKIDPYYQRQKCRPMTLVSGNIRWRCMRIFAGVPFGGGVKCWNESSVAVDGDFWRFEW